jgi:hypothetical protein
LKILKADCKPEDAKDTTLPYTAYLVEYDNEGVIQYDLTISSKLVEVFDHYYDKYHSVISIKQSDGKWNPKLWKEPKQK